VLFTSAVEPYNNHINVPLAAFAVDVPSGCKLNVNNLNSEGAESKNVVFGAQFYTAFFAATENVYSTIAGDDKLRGVDTTIYTSHDSPYTACYIGNETLPIGTNPFYTAPVTPSSSADVGWIIALVIVVIILAAFLGWAVYKWRVTSKA